MRLSTSLRSRSAAATTACAALLQRRFGISRVTDITRLDRLGLPVFASIRPRGLTLRVHAGKGLSVEDARAGALMEALEFAVAERASQGRPHAIAPLGEVLAALPGSPTVADFAPRLGLGEPPLDHPVAATRCTDLLTGRSALLPAELVLVPAPFSDAQSLFGWSTNGLASGNSLEEATLHALLEVLERDALAMNGARDASGWIDASEFPPAIERRASQWQRLGVQLYVRQVPNEFGLACFEAHLHEAGSLDVDLAHGSGLHFDREIALARAVCEAAQARLSTIHGGRDDIVGFYEGHRQSPAVRREAQARHVARLADRTRTVRFADVPHRRFESSRPALRTLLTQLRALGFEHVYRRRFDDGELRGLSVVKIVVPGCEAIGSSGLRMGRRLLRRIMGHA